MPTALPPRMSDGMLSPTIAVAAAVRPSRSRAMRKSGASGFGDVDGTIVYTLIAPPGTPPTAVARLSAALNASVSTPEMREELRKRGFVAMGGTPEELAKWTAVQAPLWGPVLQAAGVKPE